MQLFPLIPSILTKISFLVLGIEILLIVLKKVIHWGELDSNSPAGSVPTSTEMKIRPVDFF